MWAFKQLWDKGLVYEAYRVMPYSWGAETPLSNFEIRLDDATRPRQDPALTVAFTLDAASRRRRRRDTHPGVDDHAVDAAVQPRARRRRPTSTTRSSRRTASATCSARRPSSKYAEGARQGDAGQDASRASTLVGRTYTPLFPYFAGQPQRVPGARPPTSSTPTRAPASCTSRPASARTTKRVCDANGIETGRPGRRRGPLHRRGARLRRPERLRGQPADHPRPPRRGHGSCATTATTHNYPHCWRTDTPIIYRAMSSLVRRGHRVPRPHRRAQPADQLDPRPRARRRLRQVARRRARLVDLPQPLLGCAHPGVAQRRPRLPPHRRLRLDRRARARLRRRRSPTCTVRSSTTSCGRTPTTRPASR